MGLVRVDEGVADSRSTPDGNGAEMQEQNYQNIVRKQNPFYTLELEKHIKLC